MGRSGEASAAAARSGLEGLTVETATGPLTLGEAGYATLPMFVARATGGDELRVIEKIDQIEPDSTC